MSGFIKELPLIGSCIFDINPLSAGTSLSVYFNCTLPNNEQAGAVKISKSLPQLTRVELV